MKLIKLTQGQVAWVDNADYKWLNQWKWHAAKTCNTPYAQRKIRPVKGGKQETINMHRVIMNTPEDMQVDHIDHNGLNNQRVNLRNCTKAENSINRTACGKSKYLGVYFDKRHHYIFAAIRLNRKQVFLGSFATEENAAHAYDEAARKYRPDFTNFNFKELCTF